MSVPTKPRLNLSKPLSRLKHQMGGAYPGLPSLSVIAGLMKHGGFQILTSTDAVTMKLNRALTGQQTAPENLTPSDIAETADSIQAGAQAFFYKLSPETYTIPVALMSHLAFPHEGRTYTNDPSKPDPEHPGNPVTGIDPCQNPVIPAVFTFVGQFVDHDLTFNGLDLFVDEGPATAARTNIDFATPLIDLDSVYGPRFHADGQTLDPTESQTDMRQVYNGDMTFRYLPVKDSTGNHVDYGYDLYRSAKGDAFIFDPRNDENQLILQIHLLLMRLHNRILGEIYQAHPHKPAKTAFEEARSQVVHTWQSVLLHDYLPRIIQTETLDFVLTEVRKQGHGKLLHRPSPISGSDVESVNMPHEFAIGFRFGHSQLRSAYILNRAHLDTSGNPNPIPLFVRHPDEKDLRGSKPLPFDHVIDWDEFYPQAAPSRHQSLRIDSKVTHVVFDLPESTIPDNIKYVGNLPHRNLIRSRQISLACGEDLAYLYQIAPLTKDQVEPDTNAQAYFMQDGKTSFGEPFKTPLWYYVLREAELLGTFPTVNPVTMPPCMQATAYPPAARDCKDDNGVEKAGGFQLGPLGSRLIAEVIVGAIFYGKDYKWHDGFHSMVNGTSKVCLREVIDYVGKSDKFPL